MLIDTIKKRIERLLGHERISPIIEEIFEEINLPIVGIQDQSIMYTNQRFDKAIIDSSGIINACALKDSKISSVTMAGQHYLIKYIVGNEIKYYSVIQKSVLCETAPFPHITINIDGQIVWYDESFREFIYNKKHNSKAPVFLYDLIDGQHREEFKQVLKQIKVNESQAIEICTVDKVFYLVRVIHNSEGQYQCYFVDIMQYKKLEMNIIHSQKMQAIGQLAGGISHDFNNLLTAILGFCDLLLLRHSVEDPSFAEIMQIKQNSMRAANLVKQLLAVSRKQMLTPKILDVTEVVSNLTNLLRRLISENVELQINYEESLNKIKMDQGQFEQILINLAINAKDAIFESKKENGKISISLKNFTVSSLGDIGKHFISPVPHEQIVSGDYVLIEVVDNGTGISKKIINSIFEPFFSTKALGAGTGLGLSMVYGMVKQAGGYLYIDSREGEWTKFYTYFRAVQEATVDTEINEATGNRAEKKDLAGNAVILFVEDENSVRIFGSHALSNKGYQVLEAENGEEALKIIKDKGKEIDLIITDTIMPGISGPSLVMEVQKVYPDMKVLFISGYTEKKFSSSMLRADQPINFLPKPFTLSVLTTKVKEILEQT